MEKEFKQVRFVPVSNCELHIRENGNSKQSRKIVGRPIVYGVRSVNLTPWSEDREVYEVLEPGCISQELLRESDVILNINHSSLVTDVLGRFHKGKGTLRLSLHENYLEAECDLPKTHTGNDTLELIRRGDITGMSFAFLESDGGVIYENTHKFTADGKEIWLRHVKSISGIYDVSIVTHPAYDSTSVDARQQGEGILRSIQTIATEKGSFNFGNKALYRRHLRWKRNLSHFQEIIDQL